VDDLIQDLRFAVRTLLKSPGFTTVAVLCLALGIGANTTIFSVVNAVLLRPFPYADSERIVAVHETQPQGETGSTGLSYPNFQDLRAQGEVFSQAAAFKEKSLTLTGIAEPEHLSGQAISSGLFTLLGVKPVLGRNFGEAEDRPGVAGVLLVSHDLWRRRFGGNRDVLRRSVLVDGREHQVIGVMPPQFNFPEQAEAWVPLAPLVHTDPRNYRDLGVLARLKPGTSLEGARSAVETIARRLADEYPDTNAGWSFDILPLREELTGTRLPRIVLSLMGAVAFVLLIACANLANLLLARATARQREIVTRVAFGARRGRIVRQLLTESLVVALIGGALGVAFAFWGLRLIEIGTSAGSVLPSWIQLRIDAPVLLFTLGLTVATGLLFGLAPAVQAARSNLSAVLKEGGRGGGGSVARNRLRNGLVVAEVALSLVLLVGAALFVRSFLKLQSTSGGFDTAGILTLRMYLAGEGYADGEAQARRVADVIRRLESLPGIEAVGASNTIPLSGGGSRRPILVEGRHFADGEEPTVFYTGVTPHFFRALNVPLLRGRGFTESEGMEKSRVAVVNETFAERFWPAGTAVGRRFRVKTDADEEWMTIVGVIPEFKNDDIDKVVPPSAFVPLPYQSARFMGLLIRTRLDPAAAVPMVRREIRASDPDLPIFQVAPMETLRRQGFWQYQLFGGLFAVFAGLALFLAAVGVYGVLSYAVHQRQREIGIRVALGAQRRDVLRQVVGHGLALVFGGIILGFLGALAATRLISSLLYDVSATDPLSFAAIALVLAGVAVLASYLPARRAIKIDPIDVLRTD
jgi:putative ABC transport system permease protein